MDDHLAQEIARLNGAQQLAVGSPSKAVLVLAGAGSGKTKVVTLRIAHLIRGGASPENILGVTFTNKAAQEMKERVAKGVQREVWISTFHSFGARLLRESIVHLGYTEQFAIYDEEDRERLLREVIRSMGERAPDIKTASQSISRAKNSLVDLNAAGIEKEEWAELYRRYSEALRAANAVDFDDLLFLPVMLFRKHPDVLSHYATRYPFVLVDEYQDTNLAQYTLVKLLVGNSGHLFVVGDPDQSIYSWRGAELSNILNFERDYPGATVVRLEQNYRSTATILDAANAVIKNNVGRYEKSLWTNGASGEKIRLFVAASERQEAEFVASTIQELVAKGKATLRDIVLFFRTNFQSRSLEDALMSRRIPYKIFGGISFYLRKEVKDILSFLRLLENPHDVVSFLRLIHLPKRGFGEVTLAKIGALAASTGLPILHLIWKVADEDLWSTLPFALNVRQKEGWKEFSRSMNELEKIRLQGDISALVRAAIYQTRYQDVLEEDAEKKLERLENVQQLIVKAAEWEEGREKPTLAAFLEEISLASALDEHSEHQDRVAMMTVHNGKGLEFRVTFIVGLEEDLFPHINAKKGEGEIEEERRLFYVGITRAKELLYLSLARVRGLWGGVRHMRPSRFLGEIPTQYYQRVSLSAKGVSPYMPQEASRMTQEAFSMKKEAPSIPREKEMAGRAFMPGDIVFHPQFGVGRIQRQDEGSLGITYDVQFQAHAMPKKLVARFAPLSLLENPKAS